MSGKHDGIPVPGGTWCGLAVDRVPDFESATEAEAHVKALGGSGWVMTTDAVGRWPAENLAGVWLEAEIALDERRSVRLQHADGRWRLWRYTETEGHDRVVFEDTVCSSLPGNPSPRLRYRTYWKARPRDGVDVYEPRVARFCGFKEEV